MPAVARVQSLILSLKFCRILKKQTDSSKSNYIKSFKVIEERFFSLTNHLLHYLFRQIPVIKCGTNHKL